MRVAFEEAVVEEPGHVGGGHWSVGDAAVRRCHLDQRFEPEHAA